MKITNETTVTINYKVSEQNGEVLEQTEFGKPITYLQGLEMMLPAVEEAMEGRIPGDSVKIELKAEEAFGERHDDLLTDIPKADFEDASELSIGQDIIVGNGEEEVIMTIVNIGDEAVTLDGNHPFAGKDIVFELDVLDVHKTTDEDLKAFEHHHVHDENCNHE
ncbi:MAG: peptidylprolyl isomerase [Spirochaetales bacterium]|uniref:Peptidyl-prolyl cis-trans isomerase n=1 Tax=Candidatus Thalassospirochaeta sargassi TaxID=3119039 RepID=A0AAJ1ICA7_9SPIO|nr:peptidylprolyl isomerase [Spirochaetales bacterium]